MKTVISTLGKRAFVLAISTFMLGCLAYAQENKAPAVSVKAVTGGESASTPDSCRGTVVGKGVNEPDPFPGYGGFVGWESPVRLHDGTWIVGFNAGVLARFAADTASLFAKDY